VVTGGPAKLTVLTDQESALREVDHNERLLAEAKVENKWETQ
jgi:hypothetical protein